MASTIAVIGTGYVGLTTGACFAHLGHTVTCADIVEAKVSSLQRGEIPIHEAGLEEIVRTGMDNGKLSFVLGSEQAVGGAEFVYLCVPTPQTAAIALANDSLVARNAFAAYLHVSADAGSVSMIGAPQSA